MRTPIHASGPSPCARCRPMWTGSRPCAGICRRAKPGKPGWAGKNPGRILFFRLRETAGLPASPERISFNDSGSFFMAAMTTRQFLQTSGSLLAGLLLAACGKQEPAAPSASAPATAPAVSAAAPAAKVYVVGTDAAYAPFELQNEKGEIVGFDIDVARAVAQKAGF